MQSLVVAVLLAIGIFVLVTFLAAKFFLPILIIALIAGGIWLWQRS